MYEYKMVNLEIRGGCEVCGNRVLTESHLQIEVKHGSEGYTTDGCTVLIGHKKCLRSKQRAGMTFLVNKGVKATT
jgi:hypothetical protein